MFQVNLNTDTPRDKVETEMRRTHVRWDTLITHRLLTIDDFIDKFHFINSGNNAKSRVSILLGYFKESNESIPLNLIKLLMDNRYTELLYLNEFSTPSDLMKLIDSAALALKFVEDDFDRLTSEEQTWLVNNLHNNKKFTLHLFNLLMNIGSDNEEVLKVLKCVFLTYPDQYYLNPKIFKYISETEFLQIIPKLNASTVLDYVPYMKMSFVDFNLNIVPYLKGMKVDAIEDKYRVFINKNDVLITAAAKLYILPLCSYMFQQTASGKVDWKAVSENMDNLSLQERFTALCNPSAPGWFLKENMHFMLQMQMFNQQNMSIHDYSSRGGYIDPRHPHVHMFYKA